MTCLEKISRANRWRIKAGQKLGASEVPAELVSSDTDGWNGDFLIPLSGQLWHVRISDGMGWRHLSVTNAQRPTMIPSWEIMCRLKDAFFADDAWVYQIHPPREEYVNDHPACLHLWQWIDGEMPHPPIVCV